MPWIMMDSNSLAAMKIQTSLLSNLPENIRLQFNYQIAAWHFQEWGKYRPELTEQDWLAETKRKEEKQTIVAITDNQLLGSISLKENNLDNLFPTFSPWVSGLYIRPDIRNMNLSAILMREIVLLAIKQDRQVLYLFTHTLSLENYYHKFGWQEIKPSTEQFFFYLNKPILLYRRVAKNLLAIINHYLQTKKIKHDNSVYQLLN